MSLDGTTFTKQFTVQPSQFVNGMADMGTVQLDNFPVVTTGGSIVVLQDMRDVSQRDTIRRRATTGDALLVPEGRIATSARYKAEVQAVTGRLASLGFRQNDGTGNGEDA